MNRERTKNLAELKVDDAQNLKKYGEQGKKFMALFPFYTKVKITERDMFMAFVLQHLSKQMQPGFAGPGFEFMRKNFFFQKRKHRKFRTLPSIENKQAEKQEKRAKPKNNKSGERTNRGPTCYCCCGWIWSPRQGSNFELLGLFWLKVEPQNCRKFRTLNQDGIIQHFESELREEDIKDLMKVPLGPKRRPLTDQEVVQNIALELELESN